jgi:hypothetical protein
MIESIAHYRTIAKIGEGGMGEVGSTIPWLPL